VKATRKPHTPAWESRKDSTPGSASVFDDFAWWDERDVLTYITPARFAYARSVSGPLRGRRVLDLCCGGGLLAEPVAREGGRVTGIDISANALQVARRHAAESGLEIGYVRSPAELLPFAAESFDLALAFDALEHVDDLPETIQQVSRVLRPGGRLIYDTMNRTIFCLVAAIWIGENLWPGGPPKGTHEWRKLIKPRELVKLMAEHGIANVETRGFMPMGIDRRGRLKMRLGPYRGLSYVGYGVKG
jgi:2-polyprenyl-6-hydroxyphenyl methylase / 3-demethylubiquinone-9 3-methyltransferase